MTNLKKTDGEEVNITTVESSGDATHEQELPLHLDVYFQPILDTQTAAIKGAEALLRIHSDNGDLETSGFITCLDESDDVDSVDYWVIEQSLRNYYQWQKRRRQNLILYINISEKTLINPSFPKFLSKALKKYECYPDFLVLEIDIATCINPECHDSLVKLRKTGVSIAVDNIGKSYQNSAFLNEEIFDIFKLDRMLFEHANNQAEVQNQLLRLNAPNTEVIAVGIEKREQITLCQRTGIKSFQGYFASQPLPADDFESWFLRG